MKISLDNLKILLIDSIIGLARSFNWETGRWRSASEDDIFTNYVAIWALSNFDLAKTPIAQQAAQWILNQRNTGNLKWTDSTGSKPIEMTNRALIGLILSGIINSYREIDLYLSWIFNEQKKYQGAWIEETKHMGGETSYGPTLPATFLLRLIKDILKSKDKRIIAGLEMTRDWLINHYEQKSIWNFQHNAGDIDLMAVAWALRIYANCTDKPHQLQKEGVNIIKKFLSDEEKQWTLDQYQLLYNCLHSLALFDIGLDDEQSVSLVKWLMKRYERYDFATLPDEDEGIRKICGMLIAVSRALHLSEEGRNVLVSIREHILAGPEKVLLPRDFQSVSRKTTFGRNVFVVHGHDEEAKQTVARFIEKLELNAIILHEQPNEGRAIIEKFEDYSNVGFAVILLTPDDIGASKDKKNELEPRARQNVILELGYFLGKLGRKKVCTLHKGKVDIMTDFQGVLYIPMDPDGGWKLKLAREIKNSSIDIDLNKAV